MLLEPLVFLLDTSQARVLAARWLPLEPYVPHGVILVLTPLIDSWSPVAARE